MRSRKDIMEDVYATHLSWKGTEERIKSVTLELLLDIRELLEFIAERNKPQVYLDKFKK